jgi:hypothetical protein
MTALTRRNMLSAAAATAATAIGPATSPETAAAAESEDMQLFVALSAAITGIDPSILAPTVDPIDIKRQYFRVASADPAFRKVLTITKNAPNPAAAAEQVLNSADPAVKYLGRSIILAWYSGSWYLPKTLQAYNSPNPPPPPVNPDKVISPAAYTQGWMWRVAQAHPMGYSEWRFGYWAADPPPLDDFIGKHA